MFKKFLLLSVLINIVFIGIFFAYFNHFNIKIIPKTNKSDMESLYIKYPFLSRRILLEFRQDVLINFLDLRKELTKITEPYKDSIGLYFEYLPTGTSIGVNAMSEFHAASLFKVPVVMAYFHYLERTGSKDKDAVIKQSELDNGFGDLWKKGAGYHIKLSEAIRLALEQSDNTAAKVVADNITVEDFDPVYNGLDIELQSDNQGAIVTAKNYSSILKALYFSSVLDRGDSEKILEYLSDTPFDNKLAAGVPKNIKVAHKIGDFIDKDDPKNVFSDCGIVYIPKRPYAVCIISKSDEATAIGRMQNISKTIYDFVSSRQ